MKKFPEDIKMTEEPCIHLQMILKEMCRRVGADYDKMNFTKPEWYYEYSWTQGEEIDFRDWLTKYFFESREARQELTTINFKNKKRCRQVADDFVWNYSWRVIENK